MNFASGELYCVYKNSFVLFVLWSPWHDGCLLDMTIASPFSFCILDRFKLMNSSLKVSLLSHYFDSHFYHSALIAHYIPLNIMNLCANFVLCCWLDVYCISTLRLFTVLGQYSGRTLSFLAIVSHTSMTIFCWNL